MRIQKVRTDYSRKTDVAIKPFAVKVETDLTGNVNYTGLGALLSNLGTAITEYEMAYALSVGGGKVAVSNKNDKKKNLVKAIKKIAVEVNNQAEGELTKLESSGLELAHRNVHTGDIEKPIIFTVKASEYEGELLIRTKCHIKPKVYIIRYMMAPWNDALPYKEKISTTQRCVISDLISGEKYSFMGAGKGKSDRLIFSDRVQKRPQ